jgi:hypothetical protein
MNRQLPFFSAVSRLGPFLLFHPHFHIACSVTRVKLKLVIASARAELMHGVHSFAPKSGAAEQRVFINSAPRAAASFLFSGRIN